MYNCLVNSDFIKGNISTHFIGNNPDLTAAPLDSDVAVIAEALDPYYKDINFDDQQGWRLNQPKRSYQIRHANGVEVKLPINGDKAPVQLRNWYQAHEDSPLFINGTAYVMDALTLDPSATSNAHGILAPMPGKIISVEAKPGDEVKAGDKLIVMEAMKMEMSLDAPRDGVIASVNVSTDDLVSDGDVLLELEKEE